MSEFDIIRLLISTGILVVPTLLFYMIVEGEVEDGYIGVKTLYYHNTRDSAGEDQKEQNFDTGCESGACAI